MIQTDLPTLFLAALLLLIALFPTQGGSTHLVAAARANAWRVRARLSRIRSRVFRPPGAERLPVPESSWTQSPYAPEAALDHEAFNHETYNALRGDEFSGASEEAGTTDRLGLLCAALALFCGVPAGTALLAGSAVFLLQAPEEDVCPPAVALPALVFYALFPGVIGVLCLLPVLFWPGRRRPLLQLAGCFLAIGLALRITPAQPDLWLCGALLTMGALGIAALAVHPTPRAVGAFLPLRPMILLGLMQAATEAGLEASALAALAALVLDLALQTLGVLKPGWEGLLLPVPPLPGFLVLWLGLHSALGLATGAPGWTPGGLLLACLLGALSLAEGITLIPVLRGRRITVSFLLAAFFLPLLLGVLAFPLGVNLISPDMLHGFKWRSALWAFSGGDGALLALPLAWGVLAIFWVILFRPWRTVRVAGDQTASLVWPQPFLSILRQGTSVVPVLESKAVLQKLQKRFARRVLRRGLRVRAALAVVRPPISGARKRGWPDMGVSFWLLFLGLMLALAGWRA